MDIGILLLIVAVLLASSLPIGISLGVATAATMCIFSPIPMTIIAQNCFTALDSFPLLAIPFFMLAGSLMGYGGISKRLVYLADSMVGFITGGLGMVAVVACMFFAALSGSGPATVSAIGSFMIPEMKAKKYDGAFAAAISAAAGSIGVIIPPSIPFVIYGVLSGASVGELFIAGIIPGLMIGFSLMFVCYYVAKKRNYPLPERSFDSKQLGATFKDAFWALLTPVIILGGIYGGIFTPTEAAVVAVVYSLFVGKFIYKELDAKTTWAAFKDAMLVNGATSFLLGLSSSFATYLTIAQVPNRIGNLLGGLVHSPNIVLLLILIILLIVGCFMDNISSMIILTPIMLPIVQKFGIDPVHFGLFLVVALAVGFVTPPYGINLFVAAAISGERLEDISKNVLLPVAAMTVCLFLFTYIPDISMGLVKLLR